MPVSAVSFGEWLNDLPAPPRGPGSQSEAMDIARTRPDPVTLERDWCLWFGSHALRRPRWSLLVTACLSSTPCHLPAVSHPAFGELSACLVTRAPRGPRRCWPCSGRSASPLAGPAGLCSGSRGWARAPGALSSRWAASSIGRWPLPSRRKHEHGLFTGHRRPEA